jgi:hypothetical protein
VSKNKRSINFNLNKIFCMNKVSKEKGVSTQWSSDTTKKNEASPKSRRVGVTQYREIPIKQILNN